jgi:hypothetical protein
MLRGENSEIQRMKFLSLIAVHSDLIFRKSFYQESIRRIEITEMDKDC